MKGWMGTVLRVDLTDGSIVKEPLNMDLARDYVGGRGLAVRMLYDELPMTCDPLGPENMLVFINGPLTMTGALSSGRYMIVTKSPLTGTICSSNSGGYFPQAFKCAGYDAIVISGCSNKPVYLWINDDQVELRDASAIWGTDTVVAQRAIKSETHKEAKVACIGPAGENLVRFAAVMNDDSRAAARSGVGAVMGSKNLKALAIRGSQGVRVTNPEAYLKSLTISNHVKESELGMAFGEFGTPLFVDVMNANNCMPTKNFQEGFFEAGDEINGAEIIDRTLVRSKSCYGCALNCGRNTRLPEGSKYEGRGDGPEYETLFSLGSNILVGDLEEVTRMNYICNELGMDTMDAGATLAAAMELFETDRLTANEIGFSLEWGDGPAAIRLLEMIGRGEGFGKIAGLGGRHLAEKFGAPEVFMGSKGQGFAGYHPRGMVGIGLLYATSPEGGNHTTGNTIQRELNGIPEPMDPFSGEGKPEYVIQRQNETAFVESAGLCVFPYMLLEDGISLVAEFYSAAVGETYTTRDIMQLGERVFNIEREFNRKLGFSRKDDTLPKRLTEEPHPEGIGEGNVVPLKEMLEEYYRLRGWSNEGLPTPEKLSELGIR